MGRPTLLDDLRAKRIVDAVAQGATRAVAAEAANVDRNTLLGWLRKGREGVEPYASFLDRVKTAEAKGEAELLSTIRIASGKSWQAAAWLLERRHPKRYALRPERFESASKPSGAAVDGGNVAMLESLLAAAKSKVGT